MDLDIKNKGPRACTTCAKAKARCIPGPEGTGKCERCYRLRKSCGSQTPAPPRAKKEPKPTKVAALERRLDELTAQLHAVQGGASTITPQEQPAGRSRYRWQHIFPEKDLDMDVCTEMPTPSTSQSEGDSELGQAHPQAHQALVQQTQAQQTQTQQTQAQQHLCPKVQKPPLWPLPHEAAALLQHYHENLAPLFPFVKVPPLITVAELEATRPYLYKSIIMVSLFMDGARQVDMGDAILEDFGRAAISKPEKKNLDLLQGILLAVAWFHYNINSFQLTNLLFFARSICINLDVRDTGVYDSQTLEKMRAFAGCYYLNTLVFTTNKRSDVFMNTTYLDPCVKALEMNMEYPSDEFLAKLVRIQKISQAISLTMATDNVAVQSMQLPMMMVAQSFQQQLIDFKASLAPSMSDSPIILAHVNIAEVLLFEIAIHNKTTGSSMTLPERLELLWNCLSASKSFLDNRFDERDIMRPRFICLSASDFIYIFITCLKLMTLKLPGWDLVTVRKQLGFDQMLDTQIEWMEELVEERRQGPYSRVVLPPRMANRSPEEIDPFEKLAISIRHLKILLHRELDRFSSSSPPAETSLPLEKNQPALDDLDGALWLEFLGDDWQGGMGELGEGAPPPTMAEWAY